MTQSINCIVYITLVVLHFKAISCIVYCPPTGQTVQPAWKTIHTGATQTHTSKWATIPQRSNVHTGKTSLSPTTKMAATYQSRSVCTDKIKNCIDYGGVKYACQGQYASWAKINCARYCGFCCVPAPSTTTRSTLPTTPLLIPTIRTTTLPITTIRHTITPINHQVTPTKPASTCRDHQDCSLEVVDRLACHDVTIATKCQKSCGVCKTDTSTLCRDVHTNCPLIASIVCSEPTLRQECRKTCRLC